MNLQSKWFAILLVVAAGLNLVREARAQGTDGVIIPYAVQDFMKSSAESLQHEAEKWASQDRGVTAGVCLKYYFKIIEPGADGKKPERWLIGYQLGRMGHTNMNRVVITDEHGGKLSEFSEDFAGDRCTTFELSPGERGAAMAYENVRGCESIYVRSLSHPNQPLLTYVPRKDEDWESSLYFTHAPTENRLTILVDRSVKLDHGKKIRKEFESYRYDPAVRTFGKATMLTQSDFNKRFAAAIEAGETNSIHQYSTPYEDLKPARQH